MTMAKAFSRRRAIAIFAATAGLPLLTGAKFPETSITWTGHALGAPATLILNHRDRAAADLLVRRVVAEVSRLESVFSLYRADSALVELNRVGVLAAPPSDLVALLHAAHGFWEQTGGAFDPTVQPLWAVYRDHFSQPDPDPSGPSRAQIDRAVARVGFGGVRFDLDKIVMRPQMAITLNGIAQGYITDRIVDMLRDAGVTSSLVDMGEDRAIGTRADGRPWRIGLADSQDALHPDRILDIVDMAVATSSAAGFHFDDAGRFGHIVDPRKGTTPAMYRRVSVVADDAASADALSTAFTLMEEDAIASVVRVRSRLAVKLVRADGVHADLGELV
jgi:thiamine biosynthesis lipoprotein